MKKTVWITSILCVVLIITFTWFVCFENDINKMDNKSNKANVVSNIIDITQSIIKKSNSHQVMAGDVECQGILQDLRMVSQIEDLKGNVNEESLNILGTSTEKLQKRISEIPGSGENQEMKEIVDLLEKLIFQISVLKQNT